MDLFNVKDLFCHLDESKVRSSTSNKAKEADRFGTQEALERRYEEGECGFEVDAVSGKDDRGMCRDVVGKRFPPVQLPGDNAGGEVI